MFAARAIEQHDKPAFYAELCGQFAALLDGETDPIANAANTAALVFQSVPDLNWAGFYFLKTPRELVLGPFQGKPACVRIAVGRGVCGAAVERRASASSTASGSDTAKHTLHTSSVTGRPPHWLDGTGVAKAPAISSQHRAMTAGHAGSSPRRQKRGVAVAASSASSSRMTSAGRQCSAGG